MNVVVLFKAPLLRLIPFIYVLRPSRKKLSYVVELISRNWHSDTLLVLPLYSLGAQRNDLKKIEDNIFRVQFGHQDAKGLVISRDLLNKVALKTHSFFFSEILWVYKGS